MITERRAVRRFLLNLSVSKIDFQGISGKVLDFSRRGMKVTMNISDFDEKPDIQVLINRPDYNHQEPVTASVIWVKHSDGKCEIGLKFKNIPVQAKVDFLEYGYKLWLKKKLSRQQ